MNAKNQEVLNKSGLTVDPDAPSKVPMADRTVDSDQNKNRKPGQPSGNGRAAVGKTAANQEGGNSFTVKDIADAMPDASWSVDWLTQYGKYQADLIISFGKKVAVHTFRLGAALAEARTRKELQRHGAWGKFLTDIGVSSSTAWRAEELCKRAGSEDKVTGLEITKAYIQFGVSRKTGDSKKGKATTKSKPSMKSKTTPQARASRKKRSSSPARDASVTPADPSAGGKGMADEVADIDVGELFDQYAKTHGWDYREQVQVLTDYWEEEAVGYLLLAVGDAEEFKDFLDKRDAQPSQDEKKPSEHVQASDAPRIAGTENGSSQITPSEFEAVTAFVKAVGGWTRAKWLLEEGEKKWRENQNG
jgi:hypothetical protein